MKIRSRLAALGALGMVAGSMLFSAAPAQAYGPLTFHYAVVDTSNCERLWGDLAVRSESAGCRLNDSADNTFFEKVGGGQAVKITLSDADGMVAKVEMHPKTNEIWVYDTRNDGDSIYVTYRINGGGWSAPLGVTGTDDVIDYDVHPFSAAAGATIGLRVYDDYARTDLLGELYGRA
ncbi:hypothetical protein ACFV1L_24100 [Kitasatospora sp. NPDC059646]|uniref:hypothetical protein n=1 Tax=Kitasatospora sp. NPDC059646 TaxID=3346893 RepID=UPI0036C5D971